MEWLTIILFSLYVLFCIAFLITYVITRYSDWGLIEKIVTITIALPIFGIFLPVLVGAMVAEKMIEILETLK